MLTIRREHRMGFICEAVRPAYRIVTPRVVPLYRMHSPFACRHPPVLQTENQNLRCRRTGIRGLISGGIPPVLQ
jgi:hypothetical protein